MSKLFIISGPSGAGEDSIINGLKEKLPVNVIITTSTREMRNGETNGNPYYFISKEKFEDRISNDGFFEWAKQYNDNLYGVTHDEINRVKDSNKVGLWKIEYKGVITAKEKLGSDVVAIFINAPEKSLVERIKKRENVTEEFIRERLEYNKEWLNHTDIYDYEINNEDGKLEESIKKVANIIKKHSA